MKITLDPEILNAHSHMWRELLPHNDADQDSKALGIGKNLKSAVRHGQCSRADHEYLKPASPLIHSFIHPSLSTPPTYLSIALDLDRQQEFVHPSAQRKRRVV